MERATSNWVWDVAPASLHSQHLAIFSLSESLFLDKKMARNGKNELKPSRTEQVLVEEAGWCDVSYPIRGRALPFRCLRGRQRPASWSMRLRGSQLRFTRREKFRPAISLNAVIWRLQ